MRVSAPGGGIVCPVLRPLLGRLGQPYAGSPGDVPNRDAFEYLPNILKPNGCLELSALQFPQHPVHQR